MILLPIDPWITTVGSFVGLITGIFVLADRLTRGRPMVAWTEFRPGVAVLTLTNSSRDHVYLFRGHTVPDSALVTRWTDSARIMNEAFDGSHIVVLGPGEARKLEVVHRLSGDPKGVLLVIVPWRRANAWFCFPLLKVLDWKTLRRFSAPDPKLP